MSKNNKLLFYEKKLNYYKYWAKIHKISYWIMVNLILFTGILLLSFLVLQKELLDITILALILNILLIISKVFLPDKKYIQYRSVEIKLEFLIQELKIVIDIDANKCVTQEIAILTNIKKYHTEIKNIVLSEYAQHFSKIKTLEDIKELMNNYKQ